VDVCVGEWVSSVRCRGGRRLTTLGVHRQDAKNAKGRVGRPLVVGLLVGDGLGSLFLVGVGEAATTQWSAWEMAKEGRR